MEMACDRNGHGHHRARGDEARNAPIEFSSGTADMACGGMPAASPLRTSSAGHVCEARGEVRGTHAAMDGDETLRGGVERADGDGDSQDARSGIFASAGGRG